jgi:hypothetical protein
LGNVFGIRTPAQQPPREVESSVDVGQHKLLKARLVLGT